MSIFLFVAFSLQCSSFFFSLSFLQIPGLSSGGGNFELDVDGSVLLSPGQALQLHGVLLPHLLLLLRPNRLYTVKKRLAVFPSPARMTLTKLSLAGKNLIIPGQGEFDK
jgi:hypothetical protein